MNGTPPAVRFTLAEALRAHETIRFNCGPAALAAICGFDPVRATSAFVRFPGFTNPSAMSAALKLVHAQPRGWFASDWPVFGVARIQFEGPWMNEGVPVAARYRFTHWAASCRTETGLLVFDINNAGLPDLVAGGWLPVERWRTSVLPELTASVKRATGGWHITHAFEVTTPPPPLRGRGFVGSEGGR